MAELSGQTSDEVITALAGQGIVDVNPTDTVTRLAGASRERRGTILSAAFGRMRAVE